jgi:hypothetical protein
MSRSRVSNPTPSADEAISVLRRGLSFPRNFRSGKSAKRGEDFEVLADGAGEAEEAIKRSTIWSSHSLSSGTLSNAPS